jgi:hypothetical protein
MGLAEVFASGWSLVQKSPTDCGVSTGVWTGNIKEEED